MKKFSKRMIVSALATALFLSTINLTLAAEGDVEVEVVVRGESTIGVENASVYVYALNETTANYELFAGPILSSSSGRANFEVPPGTTFYAIAWDEADQVYADSGFTWENIWQTTESDSIVNVETGSERPTRYVHIYPGLYDAIAADHEEGGGEPADTTAEDDVSVGDEDSAPADTSTDEDATADASAEPCFELEVTVYDVFLNPIEGVEVFVYADTNLVSGPILTGGDGRTDDLMAPCGVQFHAIGHGEEATIYGGIYDYYYDRPNYWISKDVGETIQNVSTGLTRIPYLHLFPEEVTPAGYDETSEGEFDPETYLCGDFPDAIYAEITPEACAAIEYTKTKGIFTGTAEGLLEWNRPINRAEVTKVMLEAFDYPIVTITSYPKIFPDVPTSGEWYSSYVYNALVNEIVGGYPDGYFRPTNTINRVELLRIYIETSAVDYSDTPTAFTFFHDVDVNASTAWYIPYANYAFFNGLLDHDGNLYPAKEMTRLDVIKLLYRTSLIVTE